MSLFVQTFVLGMSHCPETNVIGNISLKPDSFAWGTNRLYIYVHSIYLTLGVVQSLFEAFQQTNLGSGKILLHVLFAVFKLSLATRKTLYVCH